MPKISRPVIYTALAAVVAYAVFLITQPDQTPTRRVIRLTHPVQAADPSGILPADLSAHFPRYTGGARDPFAPGVVIARAVPKPAAPPGRTNVGWSLTGISSVNGIASALIENSVTGESVFLQPGDQWNGMRVVSVKPDQVLFRNGLGREDTLTFAVPAEDKTATTGAATPPPAPRLPGSALSLAPYPVAPLRATPLASGSESLPILPPLSGSATSVAPPAQGNGPPPDFNGPPPDFNGPPPDFNGPPGPAANQ